MNSGDKSRLEGLNEKLNSRTKYKTPEDSREPIAPIEGSETPRDWQTEELDELLMADRRKPEPYPMVKKIFLVSLLFAICAALAASLIYFKGDNLVSTRNLEIEVEGPVSIAAGSPVEIEVTITNKNNAALDRVNMSVIFPEGTRSAENPTEELNNTKEELEELGPGGKITRNERAIFLGSEGEVKKVRISVDYRVKGSNATFTKDKIFELTIGSAPVTVSLTRPETVNSGEEFGTTVSVVANSEETLRNVILRAEYPYGWSLRSSTPAAFDRERSTWLLGDLSPGEKKTISLRGVLTGEDNEERTFRFFVGVGSGESSSFDTVLSSDSMVIAIERPSVDLRIRLNGESADDYIAPAGARIQGRIDFENNLSENLINPELTVSLSGGALDRSSVSPQSGGFYNSSSNTIIWNGSNSEVIQTLTPGDSGSVVFNFESLENLIGIATNQKIDLIVTLTGRPQNSNTNISISESRSVKIGSEIVLTAASMYSKGPIGNSGPIPPKAETETTYTISMNLANTRNNIENVKVSGTLGPNVEWSGVIAGGENISYMDGERTVVWDVGTLESGVGFTTNTREAYFGVKLIPSLGQVGGVPILLTNVALTGTDTFTNTPVRITLQPVTTRISTDPSYVQGDEIVVE